MSSESRSIKCEQVYITMNKFRRNTRPSHYFSADSVDEDFVEQKFPTEFLNKLQPNGIPPHDLALKTGMPVILLRNLNAKQGLCNGTRLQVVHLYSHVVECKILSPKNKGDTVFIPRITLRLAESTLPFTLLRRQFPIRTAFCITINKSQGQTLNNVGIFLPTSCFTHGQLYVALTRCTSFNKINILIQHHEHTKITSNIVYKQVLL